MHTKRKNHLGGRSDPEKHIEDGARLSNISQKRTAQKPAPKSESRNETQTEPSTLSEKGDREVSWLGGNEGGLRNSADTQTLSTPQRLDMIITYDLMKSLKTIETHRFVASLIGTVLLISISLTLLVIFSLSSQLLRSPSTLSLLLTAILILHFNSHSNNANNLY